jgi:hypothetical protein
MAHSELLSKALRDLKDLIAKERDPQNLRELVAEINTLLDMIEMQVARLESPDPPLAN